MDAPGIAAASFRWLLAGTTESRVVTTTAVGTSTWPIQAWEVNSQTAWTADRAVPSEVRRNWARAHRAVAGSSTGPSSVRPRASALTGWNSGFQRIAAAAAGSARAASRSVGDPRTFRAVQHS